MNHYRTIYCGLIASLLLTLLSCSGPQQPGQLQPEQATQHSPYDDSTLHNVHLPVLMPYNRLLAPAGHVVRYGNADLENHALDVQLVPGTPLLAVEDRYGVALIDTAKRAVLTRWTYADDARTKGMMTTYSGLKVLRDGATTRLYWSADNGQTHQGGVLEAEYTGGQLRVQRIFPMAPAKAPLALPNDLALTIEDGRRYLYVVLNGNNQLVKLDLGTGQRVWTQATGVAPYGVAVAGGRVFVSNWGGPLPTDTLHHEVDGTVVENSKIMRSYARYHQR